MQYNDALKLLEGFLTPKMLVVPFVLMALGFWIKNIPDFKAWKIPFILLAVGVVIGIGFQDYWDVPAHVAPQVVLAGIIQGGVATAMSQLYYQAWKQLFHKEVFNDSPKRQS